METPVIVGIAHIDQHVEDPAQAREPIDLMLAALHQAAADCGAQAALQADAIRVVRGIWPYTNPAAYLAEQLGIQTQTGLTPYGGNFVQSAVNASAVDIQSGNMELILLTGAECGNTQAKAARAQHELKWREIPGTPDYQLGADMEMRHEAEKRIRLGRPIQVYPIFETALRHHAGHSVEAHQVHISKLWARFNAVAAQNPHAWLRTPLDAAAIRTPGGANRPVSFPYPKFMNSNNNVDQGAAIIMCSTRKARALGIPEEKWVYPWAGTDAHDHYFVSNRDNLYSSPAIRIAGNRCLELAGVAAADLDLVDVYSCFPSAVQVAAAELGLDIERPLTVTGGLTWAGGPLNNYVMHSIVRMVELLRGSDQRGLITANGGYLTKHAFGVYSAAAPSAPFRHEDLQDQVDATFKRGVIADFTGTATVEGYSVMYDGGAPSKAFLACLSPEGERCWATSEEADSLAVMISEEVCGRPVHIQDHTAQLA